MKEVLIVIDMQNDFLTGALGNADTAAVVGEVAKKIELARRAGKEIVFTRDTHFENYLQTQEGKRLPVVHCIKDSDGWQIADGLYKASEKIFDKPTFGSLELAKYIQDGGYDTAELCGVCTDICVVSNALLLKAFCPDLRVVVSASACAGVTKESHESALKTMSACQVDVLE